MAKVKGPITIRGKHRDSVYTDGKHGPRVRATPTLSQAQRDAKRELPQNKRTGLLNKLASFLNEAVREQTSILKSRDFYSSVLKRFGTQKTDRPILLLNGIGDLEVNKDYPFSGACGTPHFKITIEEHAYVLDAEFTTASFRLHGHNSFYLEFMLYILDGSDNSLRSTCKTGAWLRTEERGTKYITMEFERRPSDVYYLVACRTIFGVNCFEEEYDWSSARMRFFGGQPVTEEAANQLADHKTRLTEMEKEKDKIKPLKEKERVEVRNSR